MMRIFLIVIGLLLIILLGAVFARRVRSKRRMRASRRSDRGPSSQALPQPQKTASPQPVIEPPVLDETALPLPTVGKLEATIEYTKASGETSTRTVTIYSRKQVDNITYSLSCRQLGSGFKTFLVKGISRLELPTEGICLTDTNTIRQLIDQRVPLKGEKVSTAKAGRDSSKTRTPPVSAFLTPSVESQRPLNVLLPPGAKGFAVFDLETTSKYPDSRIVEIAIVLLNSDGQMTEEWETLIDPGLPIPNAQFHGIHDSMVCNAPRFEEVAGLLATKLEGMALVAHNLHSFDAPILEAHFRAVENIVIELGRGIDTMPTPRRKLAAVCAAYGVVLDKVEAHTAMGDTRALARAFTNGMGHVQPAESTFLCQSNKLLSQVERVMTRQQALQNRPSD
jgi:DNA polymerase III epsilon subunit-like protein